MTSERVAIQLEDALCKVTALFVFTNPTETAEVMEVGFPSYPEEIINPLVHVDGRQVQTRTGVKYNNHWLLWDMSFEARQTKRVTISYSVKPFDATLRMYTPYTTHRYAIQDEFKTRGWPITREVQRVLDSIQSRTTGYVLQTGKAWDGPIGKAVISAMPYQSLRWVEPRRGISSTKDALVWELFGLEPDFDIAIEYNPFISLDEEREIAKAASLRHPESRPLWEYVAFLSPVSNEARRQFEKMKAAFPNGIEVDFNENTEIIDQKNQEHMRKVLQARPDSMTWLPAPLREVLFDGDATNGEGLNYKLLNDNRGYVIMKVDNPRLPDGRKADLWEDEYLFYGYLPLTSAQMDLIQSAMGWKGH